MAGAPFLYPSENVWKPTFLWEISSNNRKNLVLLTLKSRQLKYNNLAYFFDNPSYPSHKDMIS